MNTPGRMSYERRGNNTYYYAKVREGTRVRSVYIGSEELGRVFEGVRRSTLRQGSEPEAFLPPEIASIRELRARLDEYGELVEQLSTALLVSSGFRQHKRQWRRARRGRPRLHHQENIAPMKEQGMKLDSNAREAGERQETSHPILQDDRAVSELRSTIERTDLEHPQPDRVRSLQRQTSNTALWDGQNTMFLINLNGLASLFPKAARPEIDSLVLQVRSELEWDDSPASERLLIDDIVLRWIHLSVIRAMHQEALWHGGDLSRARDIGQECTRAEKSLERAIERLERLRGKKITPPVVVNIASQQQVNCQPAPNSWPPDRVG